MGLIQLSLFAYRLDQHAVDLLEKLNEAKYLNKIEKPKKLHEADMILSKIRIVLRLSYELKCISQGLLEELTQQLHDIGKILGTLKVTHDQKTEINLNEG